MEVSRRLENQGTYGVYEFRFLETWTRLTPDGRLDISHHHKNTHRASRGQAQVKNVAHFSSHVPPHQKFGRVVGALTSAWSHSVGHPNKVKAAVRVLHDMRHHGMPNETARAAMRRMEFKTVDPVETEVFPLTCKKSTKQEEQDKKVCS